MYRTQRAGFFMILVAALGYALLPTWVKLIYRTSDLEPLDLLFWRFAIAAPAVWALAWTLTSEKSPALLRPLMFVAGLIFSMAALSAFLALARIPASIYTVLVYTYPAIVAFGSVLLGESLTPATWLAIAISIFGVSLTVPDALSGVNGSDHAAGIVVSLFNAFVAAAYILFSSVILRGQTAILRATAWSITGSLSVALVIVLVRGINAPETMVAWIALVGLALFSTTLPILLFYGGMQQLGASRASVLSTAEPVLALALAAILLGERLQLVQVLGGCLIFGSMLLLQSQQVGRIMRRR